MLLQSRVCLTLLLALGAATTPVLGQVCQGAPFSRGPIRIGVGLGSSFGTDHYTGEQSGSFHASVGRPRGIFGRVGLASVLYSNGDRFVREGLAASTTDDATASVTVVTAGHGFTIKKAAHSELCPVAGFAKQSGPTMYSTCTPSAGSRTCSGSLTGSATTFWQGVSYGVPFSSARTIVFFGATHINSKINADGGAASKEAKADYLALNVGAGFAIKRFNIRPNFSFPTGLEDGSRSFGIDLVFNFGAQ